MTGSDQLQRMSMLTARMLPERLILGREFRPGDNLYADVDTQELVASLMGAMSLPPSFRFQLTGGLPFVGTSGEGASRSLNFAGILQASGGGMMNGQTAAIMFPGHASIAIDATTGLMRSTTTEGTMEVKVNGVTQLQMQLRQDTTCTISTSA